MSEEPDPHLHALLKVGLAVAIILLGANMVRRANSGSSAFDDTMQYTQALVYDGVNVYAEYDRQGTHSKYPPFFFLFFAPLAPLSLTAAATIFYLSSVALLWICLFLAAYAFWDPASGAPAPARTYGLPALLALAVIISNLQRGQVNILVLAFVCWSIFAFTRRRDGQAGIALGFAVALKLTPALLLLYFVWRRAWKAALGATAVLVLAWVVLPVAVLGPDRAFAVTRDWVDVVRGFSEQGVLGEGVAGVRHTNQSLSAAVHRFLTATPAGAGREGFYVNVASLDYETVGWIVRVLSLALAAGLLWLVRGPPPDRRDVRTGYEISLVLLVALFVSPISWINHYVVLIVPYAAALEGVRRSGGQAWRGLGRATVVSALLVTTAVSVVVMAYSVPLLGALLLATALAAASRASRPPGRGSRSP